MEKKFKQPTKRAKALWTQAFPAQHKALYPERTVAGGVKARSQSESVRMAIYVAIKDVYLRANPFCQAHPIICSVPYKMIADQIHHKAGRDGLLLFDVRKWVGCCVACHEWIGRNPAEAQKLGLLEKEGWRKLDE